MLDTNICAFILRGKFQLNERVKAVRHGELLYL